MSLTERPLGLRQFSVKIWVGLALLAAAFSYIWLLPLVRPRGELLWGYYRIKDLLIGIPIGLATLCAIVILVVSARHRRSLALRLTLICISAVTVLFISDIVFAFGIMGAWRSNYYLDKAFIPRKYSQADDELGFVRKPRVSWRQYNSDTNRVVDYQTDENGFRNPPGVTRADVVFIGDSYTEGAQVSEDETFVRRVATLSGLSVQNLGRSVYGPQQELIVLRKYALAYRPRVVVWQLFEGNDLRDAAVFAEWRKNPYQRTSLTQRYLSNSLLVAWLYKTERLPQTVSTIHWRVSDGTVRPLELRYKYDPDDPGKKPQGLAETTQAIQTGSQLCQSQGIKLVILFVPTMVRVMEPYIVFDRAEDRAKSVPNGGVTTDKDFSGRMAELCRQLGCTFIDGLTPLSQAAAPDNRNLFIPGDEHFDVRGHEVIAKEIVKRLQSDDSPNIPETKSAIRMSK